jgi:photosystem II stability/assembly factor-like uncharacterized protein
MKNHFTLLLYFLVLNNIFYTALHSQETVWQSVDPGGNGWLTTASIHPSSGHLFFSSDMNLSLLRSTDQGDTWTPIANPVAGTAYYIAGDPQESHTIYMNQLGEAEKTSGIWKSVDNGDSWFQLCQSREFGTSRGQSGVVDPENGQILYWTAADMGVRKSTDGGLTWSNIRDGLPKEKIKHDRHSNVLEIDHNTPQQNRRLYYPTNLGLYTRSEPAGKWRLAGNGLPSGNCNDVEVCDGGIVYAAFPDAGLYRSRDDGKSWQRCENGLDGKMPYRVVATDDHPEIVYVATYKDQGVYGSQNGGDSFRLLTHRRFNSERNWPQNYRQHEAVSGMIMFIDPNDPYTLYLDYNKKTHDGGQTWHNFGMEEVQRDRWRGTGLTLLTDYRVVFDPNRPQRIWFGFSDTGLMLSEDGGESIINVISFHRGEVNQAAYWRDKLVHSSGSCPAISVDPDLSTTIYASITGKNADDRASVGGMVIKSVDGGWNWRPVYEKNGLDDGIVRSIVIDPSSPIFNRTVYVASYGNGVYKSMDDGENFQKVTPDEMFNGNTRLMWLEMAPSDPQTLYLGVGGSYGIRPITYGPEAYPALEPGRYGGIFKTTDGGISWKKLNATREIPNVQDLAVHPFNTDIVYVAAWPEEFLIPQSIQHPEWKEGGIFRTDDGGKSWSRVFRPPLDEINGRGDVEGIAINPVAPEIIYAAIKRFGIFRSLDEGKNWEMVGKESMDRMQRRYHSIDLNPHKPFEVWVAHFGNAFSRGIDYKARDLLQKKYYNANFINNPGFEVLDDQGFPVNWKIEQPGAPVGEEPVVAVSNQKVRTGKNALRFLLTPAYSNAPSPLPAEREQLRLEREGKWPSEKKRSKDQPPTGETRSWIYQKINPAFTSMMRGRNVRVAMDVYIVERNLPDYWDRGSERGEIPRDPPQVYLTEVRDYNIHYLVAETSLEDLEPIFKIPSSRMLGRWYHCQAIGRVSEDAQWLRVTVSGIDTQSGPVELYVDNICLEIVQ